MRTYSPEWLAATERTLRKKIERGAWQARMALYISGKPVYGAAGVPHMGFHKDRRSGRILTGGDEASSKTLDKPGAGDRTRTDDLRICAQAGRIDLVRVDWNVAHTRSGEAKCVTELGLGCPQMHYR